jgi:hypothetical protein
VSRVIWVGLCTCPGTELAEALLDEAAARASEFPDMDRLTREHMQQRARERQEKRAATRAAWEATRAAAAGKSHAQVREIYVAELRKRGLPIPSDLMLDATADAIAHGRDKFSVVYSARLLADLGREFGKLLSSFGSEA